MISYDAYANHIIRFISRGIYSVVGLRVYATTTSQELSNVVIMKTMCNIKRSESTVVNYVDVRFGETAKVLDESHVTLFHGQMEHRVTTLTILQMTI